MERTTRNAIAAAALLFTAAPPCCPAAEGVETLDTGKSGTCESGKWKYAYTIDARGSRSERRGGELTFGGRPVERLTAARPLDRLRTPWGLMQYQGPPGRTRYHSGWLTRLTHDNPLHKGGRLLDAPPDLPDDVPPALTLSATDSGKAHKLGLGQAVHVQLEGNPTTGFQWALAQITGDAVAPDGEVRYRPRPVRPGVVGAGGSFHAEFLAVRPGRSVATLHYKRPWEKDTKPARTFVATFDVQRAGPVAGKQGVCGQVQRRIGNFMPGPGPRPEGRRVPLSVPVHVFRGELKPLVRPDRTHPQWLKAVTSDKQGLYRVALGPGEYTVVAEIDGRLCLNLRGPKGDWATVRVREGHWATWDIEATSKAAF